MNVDIDLFGAPKRSRNGMGGHQSADSEKEIWLTPPEILQSLGPFDLDPCACLEPRPWPTATVHYTKSDNGLMLPWRGRCWVNPPYTTAAVGIWLKRLADHGTGTALIFARTDTEAFHEQVWDRATAILFLRGRLFFHHANGKRAAHNAGAPSCLVAYGLVDAQLLRRSGVPGRFILMDDGQ